MLLNSRKRSSNWRAGKIGRKQLGSVRITHVKNWRDGLKLKPANSNRTLTSLKAALNMAVANRQCVATLAIE